MGYRPRLLPFSRRHPLFMADTYVVSCSFPVLWQNVVCADGHVCRFMFASRSLAKSWFTSSLSNPYLANMWLRAVSLYVPFGSAACLWHIKARALQPQRFSSFTSFVFGAAEQIRQRVSLTMKKTLKISLLSALFLLLATVPSSTAKCCPTPFNCDSYTSNYGSPVADSCTATSLKADGRYNDINSVKSCYLLENDVWFQVSYCVHCGIGASFVGGADGGGIRFNDKSVGFYSDTWTAFYGRDEIKDKYGWNRKYTDRLVDDPSSPKNSIAIKIDYLTDTIWYRPAGKAPVDFKLPSPFHGKPLYAHAQVWNSRSLTHDSGGECTCNALRGAFWAT